MTCPPGLVPRRQGSSSPSRTGSWSRSPCRPQALVAISGKPRDALPGPEALELCVPAGGPGTAARPFPPLAPPLSLRGGRRGHTAALRRTQRKGRWRPGQLSWTEGCGGPQLAGGAQGPAASRAARLRSTSCRLEAGTWPRSPGGGGAGLAPGAVSPDSRELQAPAPPVEETSGARRRAPPRPPPRPPGAPAPRPPSRGLLPAAGTYAARRGAGALQARPRLLPGAAGLRPRRGRGRGRPRGAASRWARARRAGVRPGRAPPPELGRAIPMMPSHRARLPERGRRRR